MSHKVLLPVQLLLLCAWGANGQFSEISHSQHIENVCDGTSYGNGVSFFDFNNDGWDDLTLGSGNTIPQFYLNNGAGFTRVYYNLILNTTGQTTGLEWVDFDNDGDSDLFLLQNSGQIHLFENDGDFNFTNVTPGSGLPEESKYYYGAGWADYDKDGFLDVFIATYYNTPVLPNYANSSRLFHNNGDGTFSDVSAATGTLLLPRPVFQPVWLDYNEDGWPDLYLVIDRLFSMNELFLNNQDGTFTNVSVESGAGIIINAMTGTVDDYDNDGDIDIYVTNTSAGNQLLRNNGQNVFADAAAEAGVTVNTTCWGALWIDYDNNGWLDLYIGTTSSGYSSFQNYFYINQQDGTFLPGMNEVGLGTNIAPTFVSAMGDMNNDGYYDYVNNNNDPMSTQFWKNDGGENNYLSVSLEGTISNRDAVGSWIKLYTEGHEYIRYTMCGENYIGQNSDKEIFGLGASPDMDSIVLFWPSGMSERYYNLAVNQHYHFTEGESFSQPFTIDADDTVICEGQIIYLDAGPGLDYLWSNGTTERILAVTDPGSYSVQVKHPFELWQPSVPVVIVSAQEFEPEFMVENVSCSGANDGSIQLMSDYENYTDIFLNNMLISPAMYGLPPGICHYHMTSIEGCFIEGNLLITEPDPFNIELETSSADCFGSSTGSAVIHQLAGGTAPYTLDWMGMDPQKLPSGEGTVTITDAHGCSSQFHFVIDEPQPLQITFSVSDADCFDTATGSVYIETISGGTSPYEINWQGADPDHIAAGAGTFLILDSNGCESQHTYEIIQPDVLNGHVNVLNYDVTGPGGSAELIVAGGIEPYTITWSNGESGNLSIPNLPPGNYSVNITDANGCSVELFFIVEVIQNNTENELIEINLYPNPACGTVHLNIPGLQGNMEYFLSDQAGQIILKSRIFKRSTTIDLDDFATGLYTLVVLSDKNVQQYLLQVVSMN